MTDLKRGEIWLINWSPARGSEQEGIRPSLILQSNRGNLNDNYHNTIVLAITTQGKDIPFHIELSPNQENGLDKPSFIKCEQIFTISKNRLIKKIGFVDRDLLSKIERAVKMVLEFE